MLGAFSMIINAMRHRTFRQFVLLALFAALATVTARSSPAQPEADKPGTARYKPALSHITLTGTIEPAIAAPGSVARLSITAEPAKGWHIYALAEKDPKDVSKPTLIVLTDTGGLRYRAAKPDRAPIERSSTVNQAGKEQFYDKPVTWTVEIEVPRDAKLGKFPIAGLVGFQSCTDTECEPPMAARFEGVLTVADKSSNTKTDLLFRDSKYPEAAKLADEQQHDATPQEKSSAPSPGTGAAQSATGSASASLPPSSVESSSDTDSDGFDEAIVARNVQSNYSTAELLFGAFFGGMLLNLMPCVFPVIGLKILSFVEQSHHHRARLLVLNLWYTLGILVVFLSLAVIAVALRELTAIDFIFGTQNGIQGYAIGVAAVMFVMALSLLGVWEIPIPGFLGSGKAGEAMMHEGAAGAIAKGVITTLLGASCSAPVVAIAFAFALDRGTPAWATIGTFAVIGIGMASPYLILGAFPRLLRFLPKPGAWMDTFKHICGFAMLGAMVWVLTWLRMPYVAPTVAFLVGLWAACWWVGRVPLTEPRGRRVRAWLEGAAFSIAAGWLAFSVVAPSMQDKFDFYVRQEIARRDSAQEQSTGPRPVSVTQSSVHRDPAVVDGRINWRPFSKALLKQLTRQHQTVMVDFTADWCPNCKTVDKVVLETDAVKHLLERHGVAPLVADYTQIPAPPELTEMLTLLKAGAIPVLAIFPADDPNNPIIFRGLYTQSTLLAALEKAGPSRSVAQMKDTAMQ
jgi:thiol:disulfide interchange protein